jgi:hypothetical protein
MANTRYVSAIIAMTPIRRDTRLSIAVSSFSHISKMRPVYSGSQSRRIGLGFKSARQSFEVVVSRTAEG